MASKGGRAPRRPKRFFGYDEVATALGITPASVRSRSDFRRMLIEGDLLSLAREIVRRQGPETPDKLDKDRANGPS